MTQFGRVFHGLNIDSICANDPADVFKRDYSARFGRAPASDHDAHARLIEAERVRIDDIFSWQES